MLKECEAELVEQPWTHLLGADEGAQLRCATRASARFGVDGGSWNRPVDTTSKLKIAYMSGDFRDHRSASLPHLSLSTTIPRSLKSTPMYTVQRMIPIRNQDSCLDE